MRSTPPGAAAGVTVMEVGAVPPETDGPVLVAGPLTPEVDDTDMLEKEDVIALKSIAIGEFGRECCIFVVSGT